MGVRVYVDQTETRSENVSLCTALLNNTVISKVPYFTSQREMKVKFIRPVA